MLSVDDGVIFSKRVVILPIFHFVLLIRSWDIE